MELLIGFEHNYVMPYGVMLQSLVFNNQGEDVHIHAIIDKSVTDEDKKSINGIITQFNNSNHIEFYIFDKSIISSYSLPTTRFFRESCYYRLFASSILPTEIDKVLYLDGDMVVRHNLAELWNCDIEGCAVAGVINQTETVKYHNRLHYPFRKKYINNGVAIFNLKLWREKGIEQQFVDYIKQYPERILSADQDVINVVLQDTKKILPIKYNVQEVFYYCLQYMTFDYWEYQKELDVAITDPWILHFAGANKPWLKGCKHPLKEEFFKYQKETIWRDMPLEERKKTWREKVRKPIFKLLEKLTLIDTDGDGNYFVKKIGQID